MLITKYGFRRYARRASIPSKRKTQTLEASRRSARIRAEGAALAHGPSVEGYAPGSHHGRVGAQYYILEEQV